MPLIEYSREGAVALIRLQRPPVNALSEGLTGELEEAIQQAGSPEVRAVVVTGEPHFAAGADIAGFRAAHQEGSEEQLAHQLSKVIRKMEQLTKPVIAAVRGSALGGGLELAMGADFRYLADDAQVGQPEIKLGIIPGAGGTQRLVRLVGLARAREIVFSGRFVTAEEAAVIGLADRVMPADQLLSTALADAAGWAEGPTVALGAAKRALLEGWGRPIDEGLEIERRAFADCFWTDDAREGVVAFIEKRPAVFTGR